jgi:hypothetical protein
MFDLELLRLVAFVVGAFSAKAEPAPLLVLGNAGNAIRTAPVKNTIKVLRYMTTSRRGDV